MTLRTSLLLLVCNLLIHTIDSKATLLCPENFRCFEYEKLIDDESSIERSKGSIVMCAEPYLLNIFSRLRTVNPEDIVRLATKRMYLDYTCEEVGKNVALLETYEKICGSDNTSDYYTGLMHGLMSFNKKLCQTEEFNIAYRKHSVCLSELHGEFEDCLGPVDWAESEHTDYVCEVYEEVSTCFYIKSVSLCCLQAAALMKELLCAVFDSILTVDCPKAREEPVIPPGLTVCAESASFHLAEMFPRANYYYVIIFIFIFKIQ